VITRAVSRDDPAYVRKQLERGTPFRVVRRAGEVVACASADLVHGAKTAELTDVATAPSARGEGLAKACLAGLLDDLQALGFPTAYTLSRVAEPGINRAFARLGFVWRGSMRSSCRIGDGLEDMHVWSRAV
jgi:putative beta-lysine N-acetyltransferase